jgi:GR25 family glycosyltransferase involved in LPS biosynthesis
MSHYKLWQHIVDHKLNNVLVLEDDARPAMEISEFNERLKNLNVPEDYDLVYLGCFGSCDTIGDNVFNLLFGKKNKDMDEQLMIPSVPLGTHAYIISNNGAQKLLNADELKKVKYHIDYTLANYMYPNHKDFKVLATKTPLIMQSNDINSSDLLTNDHPIISYFFSKIKISENYNLDYIMNAQILNIRKMNINITGLLIMFAAISFLVGMLGSHDIIRNYCWGLVGMYFIEFMVKKKTNWGNLIFEVFMIMLFLQLGIRFNKKI